MSDFFISYAREDQAFVRRLHEALSEHKRQTWVDWRSIAPTAEWLKEIYSAIEAADAFIFVISPPAINSRVCKLELDHAVNLGKRLIPIVCCESREEAIPEPLAKLNWVLMRESDDFASGVAQLLQVFDTDIEWVRAHTRLLVRANEWQANKRDNSFLLRGSDLAHAERWIAHGETRKDPVTTALQTQYLFESRRAATKRQHRTLGAVGFALVLTIGLAIWAYIERGTALYTLAQSDFFQGLKLIEAKDTPAALAYLARALRNNPTHNGAAARVQSLLTQRRWMAHERRVDFTEQIIKAVFLPDRKKLAIASKHGIWVLELVANQQRLIRTFEENVENIAGASRDVIVVTTSSRRLLCDLNGEIVWSEPRKVGRGPQTQTAPVYRVSRDGFFVASANPGVVLYKQVPTGNVIRRIRVPDGTVTKLDFSEDGGTLLIYTTQGSHLVNLTDGSTTGFISEARYCFLHTPCHLSPDGSAFVYEDERRRVMLKDLKSQNPPVELLRLLGTSSGLFNLSLFGPNSQHLFVAATTALGQTQVQLFRSPLGSTRMERIISEPEAVRDAAYHPSGRFLALAAGNDVLFVNTEDVKTNAFEPIHFDDRVMTVGFHATDDLLLTLSGVHVDLWDVRAKGNSLNKFQVDARGMLGFGVHEDQLYLASPGMVTLMDLQSGSVVRQLPVDIGLNHIPSRFVEVGKHPAKIHGAAGKLAIPKPNQLEIYDLLEGRLVTNISVPWKEYDVAFSRNGKQVVVFVRYGNKVLVLDLKGTRSQWLENLSHQVGGAALSADGKLLALFGREGIEMRSLPDGDILRSVDGAVIDADFSPDGRFILVHHYDEGRRRPRIWTANLSRPVSRLFGWDNYDVNRARFSDNGELVIFEISRYVTRRDTVKGAIILESRSFQPVTDIVETESAFSLFAVSQNGAWNVEFEGRDLPYKKTENDFSTIVPRPFLQQPSAKILSSLAQIAEDTGGMRLTSENVLVTIDPDNRKMAYTKLFQ